MIFLVTLCKCMTNQPVSHHQTNPAPTLLNPKRAGLIFHPSSEEANNNQNKILATNHKDSNGEIVLFQKYKIIDYFQTHIY